MVKILDNVADIPKIHTFQTKLNLEGPNQT